jgi:hypothetical protein
MCNGVILGDSGRRLALTNSPHVAPWLKKEYSRARQAIQIVAFKCEHSQRIRKIFGGKEEMLAKAVKGDKKK